MKNHAHVPTSGDGSNHVLCPRCNADAMSLSAVRQLVDHEEGTLDWAAVEMLCTSCGAKHFIGFEKSLVNPGISWGVHFAGRGV